VIDFFNISALGFLAVLFLRALVFDYFLEILPLCGKPTLLLLFAIYNLF